MKILQLIDSLDAGGAEMMAVSYANALNDQIEFSGIVATRKEGELKGKIENPSHYMFLNRKKVIDFNAVLNLKKYIKKNKIDFIHAHGTSFFIAVLTKIIYPKIKVVWHDHSGERANQNRDKNMLLRYCSFLFSGCVVVNHSLEDWAKKNLKSKNILYLPNFTRFNALEEKITSLKGEENKRIVCLANLREPKNHQMLVNVAALLVDQYPDWTFHFIGNDLNDNYSLQLKKSITQNSLNEIVYIYGLKMDTANIINQSTIAVLSSTSEGLPVALLEYGLLKKAVVATAVGEIPLIIKNGKNGFIVPPNEVELFLEFLIKLIENSNLRSEMGNALYKTIYQNHSQESVINQYLNWLVKI